MANLICSHTDYSLLFISDSKHLIRGYGIYVEEVPPPSRLYLILGTGGEEECDIAEGVRGERDLNF